MEESKHYIFEKYKVKSLIKDGSEIKCVIVKKHISFEDITNDIKRHFDDLVIQDLLQKLIENKLENGEKKNE